MSGTLLAAFADDQQAHVGCQRIAASSDSDSCMLQSFGSPQCMLVLDACCLAVWLAAMGMYTMSSPLDDHATSECVMAVIVVHKPC